MIPMSDDFYGIQQLSMCKANYAIEQIRKATVDENLSADLLLYLDRIAEAWSKYFTQQLPDYIALASEQITPVEKVDKETYEQLYTALYEALGAIFRIWQHDQYEIDNQSLWDSPFSYSFSISDIRMEAYINERAWTLIKEVDSTTQQQIQSIIAQWQSSGAPFEQVAEKIYTKFSQYTQARSYLIARQELRTALEFGRQAQFQEDAIVVGVEGWKRAYDQWDNAVRPTHTQASEVWRIPANQSFPWVEKQRPPFDFWCRCTATYRLWHPDHLTTFTP